MTKTVLILSIILCASFARAANIVGNPGFETGDFTSWTLSGTDSSTCLSSNSQYCGVDGNDPHSGTYEAFFGPVGGVLQLSQSLNTIAGAAYNITFWLNQDTDPTTAYPNSFAFSWGGTALVGPNPVAMTTGYTKYGFSSVLANSNSTDLAFSFRNDAGYFELDDVSVTPATTSATPEPSSIALVALSICAGLVVSRKALAWRSR